MSFAKKEMLQIPVFKHRMVSVSDYHDFYHLESFLQFQINKHFHIYELTSSEKCAHIGVITFGELSDEEFATIQKQLDDGELDDFIQQYTW